MFKFKKKYQDEVSNIQPNEELQVDDFGDYKNVFVKDVDPGHLGLLDAYKNKQRVRIKIKNDEDATEEIVGTISHYDDNYSQLVVVAGNTLKRLTFDQIEDVIISPKG